MKKRFWIMIVSLMVFALSPAALGKEKVKILTASGEAQVEDKFFRTDQKEKRMAFEIAFAAAKEDAKRRCGDGTGRVMTDMPWVEIMSQASWRLDESTKKFVTETGEITFKCRYDDSVDKNPRVTTNQLKPGEKLIDGKIYIEKPAAQVEPAR